MNRGLAGGPYFLLSPVIAKQLDWGVPQCSQNRRNGSGQELPKKASHHVPLAWFVLCFACLSHAPSEKYLWLIVLGPGQHGPDSQQVPRKS